MKKKLALLAAGCERIKQIKGCYSSTKFVQVVSSVERSGSTQPAVKSEYISWDDYKYLAPCAAPLKLPGTKLFASNSSSFPGRAASRSLRWFVLSLTRVSTVTRTVYPLSSNCFTKWVAKYPSPPANIISTTKVHSITSKIILKRGPKQNHIQTSDLVDPDVQKGVLMLKSGCHRCHLWYQSTKHSLKWYRSTKKPSPDPAPAG